MSLNSLRIRLLSLSACLAFAGLTCRIHSQPACFISGGSNIICDGESATWSAPDGMSSYYWTGPGNFSSFSREITINTAGEYTVLVTDLNGQNSCSRMLSVYPDLLPGSINTTTRQFCTGGTTAIGGSNAPYGPARGGSGSYAYTWQLQVSCSGEWTDIPGTNTTSYTPVSPPVTTCYRRKVSDNICGSESFSEVKRFEMFDDPTSQEIMVQPDAETICAGTPVSAVFTGGSGGYPGGVTDIYEYSITGGADWLSYNPGDNIPTAGVSGTNILRIRTRRISTGVNGCNYGAYVTRTFNVNPVPLTPQIFHR